MQYYFDNIIRLPQVTVAHLLCKEYLENNLNKADFINTITIIME